MPRHEPLLRLADRFTHLVESAEGSVLVGGDDAIVLEWPNARDVVRLLDGRRNAVQIAQVLEEHHRPEIVHFVLIAFERNGITAEARGPLSQDQHAERTPAPGTNGPLVELLRTTWEARGQKNAVRVPLPSGDGMAPILVLTDDYLEPELSAVVGGSEGPALLAQLGGSSVWVGPSIANNRSACLDCLQERLRMNLSARALVHLDHGAAPAGLTVTRLATQAPTAAYELLAQHVTTLAGGGDSGYALEQLTVHRLDGSEPERHAVARLADCAACGDPMLAPPGPDWELASRPRLGDSGGGYRILDPAETYDRYAPLISPLTGVVRHVRKVPVEDTDLVHVYTASHSHHYHATTVRAVKNDRRDHSGGKGMTDLDARVSALCEALERFSAVRRGQEPARIARRSELGPQALSPNQLMLFSPRQFEAREESNAGGSGGFHWVPEPYDDEPIEWSQVRSLVSGEVWWVPSAFIYLGFKGEGGRFCKGDSNGLAGGNCLEEAILQGFLEVVERDAVALWWYNRASRPGVDLEALRDPFVDPLIDYYPSLGRTLWALDLTTDLQIPCFAALSALTGEGRDIIFGFGAHLDARIALRRALTEVNQMLPTVLRTPEERRRQLLPDFADAIHWWESESLETQAYLLPSANLPPGVLAESSGPTTHDLREIVQLGVQRAARAGVDVLVHDLTRPSVEFAVAKIVAPGLRHFWRRLGPGRLYNVPAQLGWVATATGEDGMNPVSVFV